MSVILKLPLRIQILSIRAHGIQGELFVHELSEVQPGTGPEYIHELTRRWAPVRCNTSASS